MDLLDRFMSGLELRDPGRVGSRPLDIAVFDDTQTLLLLANWWTVDWGTESGLLVIPALLDPKTMGFSGLEDAGLLISSASDQLVEDHLRDARMRTDINRSAYYAALQALSEFEPRFDFAPWIEAMQRRPELDAAQVLRERTLGMRAIGIIRLLDSDAVPVDALAIDAHGQFAVGLDDGWLALFGSQWAGYAETARPDIAAFLTWLSGQTPYGPFSIDTPKVTADEGELQALVVSAIARNSNP